MDEKCRVGKRKKQSLAAKTQDDAKYPEIVDDEKYKRFRNKPLYKLTEAFGKELVGKIILTEEKRYGNLMEVSERQIIAVDTEAKRIKLKGKGNGNDEWMNPRYKKKKIFIDIVAYEEE